MSDSDVIKNKLAAIVAWCELVNRETGKLVDPPDFARCFDAVEDIQDTARSLWVELDEWEREENS